MSAKTDLRNCYLRLENRDDFAARAQKLFFLLGYNWGSMHGETISTGISLGGVLYVDGYGKLWTGNRDGTIYDGTKNKEEITMADLEKAIVERCLMNSIKIDR